MKYKVIAIVVTYNRKELLLECIGAILKQTYSIDKLILIDNCSTDGTADELRDRKYIDNPKILFIRTESNIGGAGGFYEGMLKAKEYQYDWLWIMDDDTIPAVNCLEKLIEAAIMVESAPIVEGLESAVKPSFFASAVYGVNGEFMNVPKISKKKALNGYSYWYNFLDKGLINISMATFVSILIKKEAINICGLPCKDFFIWGDDSEYTTRLTEYYGDAYLVGASVVVHKRSSAKALSIKTETDPRRIEMFSYQYRNSVIINRFYQKGYHTYIQVLLSLLSSLHERKLQGGF